MDNIELPTKFQKAFVFVIPIFLVLGGAAVYAMLFVNKAGARNLNFTEITIVVSAYVYAYFTKFQSVSYKLAKSDKP